MRRRHRARAAKAAVKAAPELSPFLEAFAYAPLAAAALAAGDMKAAIDASDLACQRMAMQPAHAITNVIPHAEIALARGDVAAAKRWADESVSTMHGWHRAKELITRARVAIAQGALEEGECDAREALADIVDFEVYGITPDALEVLADLAAKGGRHREAARLFGSADAIRQRMGIVRLGVHEVAYAASVALVLQCLGDQAFESAVAPKAPRFPSMRRSRTRGGGAVNASGRRAGGHR